MISKSLDSSSDVVADRLQPASIKIVRIRIENIRKKGIVLVFMGFKRLSWMGCSIARRGGADYGFQHTGQFAARQHHPPLAAQAFQPDISAQAGNFPLETATGMLFAQPENIVKMEFR